ncbi:MAG: hypothetical protein HGB10_08740 [Coriobacteriia bacterium]|nr:hypothetical protein [Coriobacteriia bacterium]
MLEAIGIAVVAQLALVISGLIVYRFTLSDKVIGLMAGFGVGSLIEAVAFDLVAESKGLAGWEFGLWMLLGAAVFLVGDWIVEKRFSEEGSGQAMGIVVGSIVDGVPESVIFGIQVATAFPLSPSFLIAVFISNFPQALAPSADLARAGWKRGKLVGMWSLVLVACGVASALGWGLANYFSDITGDRMAALAAGGLLSMIAVSMMPFAVQRGGNLVAVGVVLGFCLPLILG